MKTVLLKPRFSEMPLHALYNELKNNPPDNYKIISPILSKNHLLAKATSKYHNYLYKQLVYHLGSLPYVLAQLTESSFGQEECDLVYATQHVINSEKPWLVDLEFSNALCGYCSLTLAKNIIVKKLRSKTCKGILPWSNWAKETLLSSIDCKDFLDKITVVRYTVSPKDLSKIKRDRSTIRIFFLGSMNPGNLSSFEFKGLYETVDAFLELQRKYENLELIIRSIVPSEIKERVKNFSNIRLLDKPISPSELENLYLTSHIFPHSGFEVLNLSVLEAMSYGLPVIATSLYSTSEAIHHMKNGILIDLPDVNPFYTKQNTPNDFSKSFVSHMRMLRPYMKDRLKEYLELLIEDESLRDKIGREATLSIEKGEFSIEKRNKILKDVFDKATS